MARILELYNHHRDVVGTAKFHKKVAEVEIKFIEEVHYANIAVSFDDYENYKRRMDLKDENELGQLELF